VRSWLALKWRLVATGFCFAVFGLGGLTVGALLVPLRVVLSREQQRRLARVLLHRCFWLFVWLMKTVRVLTYEVRGAEKLQRPSLLVMANHPTLIDVVFLVSLMPQALCVVRSDFLRNPFTGPLLSAAQFLDSGESFIESCRTSFASGDAIIVFPEGTRTPRGAPMTLKRGAANVAIRCQRDVTPVLISCRPLTLGKGEPWYRIPPSRPHFVLEVGDDLRIDTFLRLGEPEPISVRKLNMVLHSYFQKEPGRVRA
jgi:1-acyl-sn-glycerol-3-phosphate acyltransferase